LIYQLTCPPSDSVFVSDFGKECESTFVLKPMHNRLKIYWRCQFIGWGLFTLGNVLNAYARQEMSGADYLFSSISIIVTGISVTHIYRYFIHGWGWKQKTIPSLVLRILAASFVCGMFIILLNIALGDLRLGRIPFYESFSLSKFVESGLVFIFLSLLWSFIYFAIAQFQNYKKEEIKNLELHAAKTEIEMNNFKAQVNPHFMFNCMNSIRALVDENPDKAKQAITLLSGMLRNNFLLGKKPTVALREELELVEKYLSLEKIRFEERLHVELQIDPATLSFEIPPFMLQTVVENAVKHGISKRKEGGIVLIRASVEAKEHFSIRVSNSGTWSHNSNGTGIGLLNTRKRLELIFGNQASFTIGQEEDNVVANFLIPKINLS